MMKPPIPDNEAERLHLLGLYRILDTAAEKTFDDLTRLATVICEVPVGMVSLVDRDRQWFKSCVGLDASETPRDQAFCAWAILSDEPLLVEDATKDPRFADNPLVTGEPFVRFYAGAPLTVADGMRMGTLCVVDRVPRRLDSRQLEALCVLRQAVVTQLEARRQEADLRALGRLLPMCSWCHAIRTDDEDGPSWSTLDRYVMRSVAVTHSICPSCAEACTTEQMTG